MRHGSSQWSPDFFGIAHHRGHRWGGGIEVALPAWSAAFSSAGEGLVTRCNSALNSRACSSAASISARRAPATRSHPDGMSRWVGARGYSAVLAARFTPGHRAGLSVEISPALV
jgi:hypothetical protein